MIKTNSPKFKFLAHTADIKFQAFGNSIEEVFKNSALALGKSFCEKKVRSRLKKEIRVQGKDFESLLYNFLEEFLILFDSERFLISDVSKIKIDKKKFELTAEVSGDNSKNYNIETHVKAITYNEMFVKKIKDKFISQVVVDV